MFKFKVNDEVIVKTPHYNGYFDPDTYEVSTGTVIGCNFSQTKNGDEISYTVKVKDDSRKYDESKLELLTDEMKNAAKNRTLLYCPKCGEIFEIDADKTYTVKTIDHNRCVYSDCGYGDYDEFADIEYTHICQKCPKCEEEVRIVFFKEELKETRHNRWGDKK